VPPNSAMQRTSAALHTEASPSAVLLATNRKGVLAALAADGEGVQQKPRMWV
jgi:hypothetical protein